MNDLDLDDGDDSIDRDRRDSPAVDREIESPAKHHPRVRRRLGGRLFALGGFLLLAGGLSLGVWGKISQQRLEEETFAGIRGNGRDAPCARS